MEYEKDFVKSFAHRTLSNLERILKPQEPTTQDEGSVATYEVTQFVNSMLGLLVFPKEEGRDLGRDFPTEEIKRLFQESIEKERQIIQDEEDAKNQFWQFLRRIRNAIAHEKISPVSEDGSLYSLEKSGEKNTGSNPKIAGFVFGDNVGGKFQKWYKKNSSQYPFNRGLGRFEIYLTNKQICDVLLHICGKILSGDAESTEMIQRIREKFKESQSRR